jgi:hypothetical protein
MALRSLALALPTTVLLALGCSAAQEDPAGAEENATTAKDFAPYSSEVRPGLRRLAPFDPQNANVGNFGAAVQNQGSIASCASFGFLGLLENQLWNERGVAIDLSERYQIYTNFLEVGTLGGEPKSIAKFPAFVESLGLLPEDVYPYAAVDANAHRFDQDAAQGLTTSASPQPSLASVVAPTAPRSKARSEILERGEFIGALPAGPFPVTIPIKARLEPGAKVPEVELDRTLAACFTSRDDVPADRRLKLTPREFLKVCFDLDPKAYFTCGFDPEAAAEKAAESLKSTDDCGKAAEVAAAITGPWLEARRKALTLTLALLDHGDATMLGVTAPASPNNIQAVWSTKNLVLGAGHAVLATGYVTFPELESAVEQSKGLLASGIFDKLAAMVDPEFAAKLAAGLPADPALRSQARVASRLGQRMKTEGGLIVFRNSWGKKLGDVPIGVEGNQAMTFDYFLKTGMLVQGRSAPKIPGVAWNVGAGPDFCPATVDVPQGGGWLASPDRLKELAAHVHALVVPPTCAKP